MERRQRARELGIQIGRYATGTHNAITDVAGIRVGHYTLNEDTPRGVARTGVTVIEPNVDIYRQRLFAGASVINGSGELTGMTQISEWGILETPIALTSTMNVGNVTNGVIEYMFDRYPDLAHASDVVLPVVGECNDSTLNDARGRFVQPEHVIRAFQDASDGPVAEGCVGGGTGMSSFDFKGGIGTSSRRVADGFTVGILVMSNFGDRYNFTVDGLPIGRHVTDLMPEEHAEGSIIVIIATDAPLLPHQLQRLAKRASLGLGKAGSCATNGSGEIALAFSTANTLPRDEETLVSNYRMLRDESLNPLFEAVVEGVEEAVLNAVMMAETTVGRNGNTVYALPIDRTLELMKKFGYDQRLD
jgi:D-aminopeptidase